VIKITHCPFRNCVKNCILAASRRCWMEWIVSKRGLVMSRRVTSGSECEKRVAHLGAGRRGSEVGSLN